MLVWGRTGGNSLLYCNRFRLTRLSHDRMWQETGCRRMKNDTELHRLCVRFRLLLFCLAWRARILRSSERRVTRQPVCMMEIGRASVTILEYYQRYKVRRSNGFLLPTSALQSRVSVPMGTRERSRLGRSVGANLPSVHGALGGSSERGATSNDRVRADPSEQRDTRGRHSVERGRD